MGSGFDTCVWGHLVWQLKNIVAYISTTQKLDSIHVQLIYALFTILIPCEPCRKFYTQCWCISCPSSKNYLDWVYDIHSIITCKVRVTKNRIKDIGECIVPGITRSQFYRRVTVLDAGDSMSSWSIIDLLFLIALQVHNKQGLWAYPHFVNALSHVLEKSYRYRSLARCLKGDTQKGKKGGENPVDMAYRIYRKYSQHERTPTQTKKSMVQRLELGRGSICKWIEKTNKDS